MTEGTGPENNSDAPASAISLCEVLDTMAGELEGVRSGGSGGRREYSRGDVFATCEGEAGSTQTAEFRLRPEIVDAATRTPGATPSRRGPDWVSLRVVRLDTFALDRARAWFEAAWRIAGEPRDRAQRRPLQ